MAKQTCLLSCIIFPLMKIIVVLCGLSFEVVYHQLHELIFIYANRSPWYTVFVNNMEKMKHCSITCKFLELIFIYANRSPWYTVFVNNMEKMKPCSIACKFLECGYKARKQEY
jgi:protein gp37